MGARIRDEVIIDNIKYTLMTSAYNTSGYYYKAEYTFNDFDGWGGTIKVNLLDKVEGIPVNEISGLFSHVEYCCKKSDKNDKTVTTLDMSGSDFSCVVSADKLFAPFYNYTIIKVIYPKDGDKRLAPTYGKFMFRARFDNVQDAIDGINFSRLRSAAGLFAFSNIDEFDFDRNKIGFPKSKEISMAMMFSYCENLKTVKGSINYLDNGRVILDTSNMFISCENLETVGDSVFSDTTFSESDSMFEGCRKLIKCGLSWNNFELYGKKSKLRGIFERCNRIDIDSIRSLITCLSRKTIAMDLFKGCSVDIVHGAKIEIFNSHALFGSIESNVIDLSGIEIREGSNIKGVLDLFLKSNSVGFSSSVYNTSSTSSIAEYMSNRLPIIIIVNRDMPIHNKDYEVFDMIQTDSSGDETIDVKISTMKMFGIHSAIIIKE